MADSFRNIMIDALVLSVPDKLPGFKGRAISHLHAETNPRVCEHVLCLLSPTPTLLTHH